uniref:Uncharacterized protein LOC105632277 isoform X4 n=1 Tax=Rhizophora mucronata TaxID=61149 RepID=A0A2P2M6V4_RHIMU
MDYDDNDFQSQNLHLAGEGSNRFPPALRSYSIPKFDFDESLPGAVRFDSLVETEVFLGIDNNEDNQWIEDFSRGHSGIHFNSGEVESCSISRCNNVWSEATSSESVEMLLKSVGQEEIVPVQTDNKESNACDELACIIKPMEPSLKQNNGTLARMDDLAASDLQPTSPPVNVLDNVCLLDDVEGLQPQVDTGPLVTQVDVSVGKGSDDLSAISVEGCLTIGEGSSIKDGIHDYGNQSEADNVINEALDDRKEKTSPRMHADSTFCSSQNTTVGSDVLNNEVQINNMRQTSDQKIEALETNKGEHKEEQHASSQEFQRFDQVSDDNLLESDVSHLEETISIDKKLSNVERTSCTMAKVDSGLSDSLVIRDPSGINMKLLGTEGNCLSERHDGHDSSGSSMDSKNLVSDAGPSPLSAEENDASKLKLDDSSEGCFGSISSLTFVSSSAKPFSEIHVEGHDSCSTLAQSTESFERNINSEEVDLHKHDHDLSVEEKEGTALCPDNSNMPSDVTLILDRGVQTLSSDGGGAENKLIDSQLQSDDACGKETAVVGNGVSPDAVVDHTEVEMSHRPLVSLAHKERDNEAMVSPEASILDLKTSSQLRSGPEPASEYEEGAAGQIVCESADQPLLMPDGCKTKSHGEGQTAVNSKDSQESTEEMRVLQVFNDLSTNKSDAVTLLVKDIDEKESSKVLG